MRRTAITLETRCLLPPSSVSCPFAASPPVHWKRTRASACAGLSSKYSRPSINWDWGRVRPGAPIRRRPRCWRGLFSPAAQTLSANRLKTKETVEIRSSEWQCKRLCESISLWQLETAKEGALAREARFDFEVSELPHWTRDSQSSERATR